MVSPRTILVASITLALMGVAPAPGRAQLVISQVYGGGNQQGSLYAADFIELHNPSSTPVNFAQGAWAVHYRTPVPGATSSWAKTTLTSGVVPAGGYFLIRTITPGSAYLQVDLPAPDATAAAMDIQPVAGQVALTAGNATLASGAACPPGITGGSLADFVGWGNVTSCSEPMPPASTVNNAQAADNRSAVFRRGCGAIDTNNNGADFVIGLPSPRNSATAPSIGLSAWGGASPAIVRAGDPTLLTVIPRLCGGGGVTGAAVTVSLADIGGTPAQVFLDDGASGDEIAGDGIYSRLVMLPPSLPPGARHLAATIASGSNSGGTYISLFVSSASGPSNDACRSAQPIPPAGTPGAPGSYGEQGVTVIGNLTGAREESNPTSTLMVSTAGVASMNGSTGAKRGIWYSVIGAGTHMTAETCTTAPSFDSIVQVLCGSCDGLSVVAAGEDDCFALSRATWCAAPGQIYYIWVARHSTNGGASTDALALKITDDGAPCSQAIACEVCAPAVPLGAIHEGETPAGPGLNDGCDASPVAGATAVRFTEITPGAGVLALAGSSRAYGAGAMTAGTIDPDWYRFQAPSDQPLTASVIAQFPVLIQLRPMGAGGACPAGASLASSTAARCQTATLSAPLTMGNWYALRVTPDLPGPTNSNSGFAAAATSSHYVLAVQMNASNPPSCAASAAPASVSSDGFGAATFTVVVTPGSNPPGIAHTVSLDLTSLGGSPAAPMFEGPANTFTLTHPVPAGTVPGSRTIIATTTETDPGGRSTTCQTTVTVLPSPPANDICDTAQVITENSMTEASNVLATPDAAAPLCLALVLPAGQALNAAPPGVWFRVTPAGSGTITADTFASPATPPIVDTEIRVFSGFCGALSCITANDDLGPPGTSLRSKVAWQALAGADYFILVNPNGPAEGSFVLRLTHAPTPQNDACSAATPLAPAGGMILATTIGATGMDGLGQGSDAAGMITALGCAGNRAAFDVWFSIVPACSGPVTFETCGGYDTLLSIHTSCPEPAPGSLQMLAAACGNDGPPGCAPGSSVTASLDAGSLYLVRIAGGRGYEPGEDFTLTWTSASGVQPPASAAADPPSFCISSPPPFITLTAAGGSGDTLEWFLAGCGPDAGGGVIGFGSPLIVGTPASTTTYFARWSSPCGASACAEVTVQVSGGGGGGGGGCCGGACCVGSGLAKSCVLMSEAECTPAGPNPSRAFRGDCTVCMPNACCPADYSNNALVNVQDIFAFLTGWFTADPAADFDASGTPSVADIFAFLARWFSGC